MEREDRRVHTVARDILDVLVMHDRVNKAISQEVLVHVVVQLLFLHGSEPDAIILEDVICRLPEFMPCLLAGDVLGVDVEGLKKTFLDFL